MLQQYHDPFVTASRPIDGVKFYLTSSPDVATFLNFPEASMLVGIGILFLNKTEQRFTFFGTCLYHKQYIIFPKLFGMHLLVGCMSYDVMYCVDYQGGCATYDFAHFVYENKLASAEARAQETAPPTIPNPIPIEEQARISHIVYNLISFMNSLTSFPFLHVLFHY